MKITIQDPRIIKHLTDKNDLVKAGRAISRDMERIENKIQKLEEKEKKITASVQPKELGDKAEALKAEIDAKIKEFEKVANEITKVKLDAIPEKIATEHKDLMKQREELERERNKVALKIQKIKDRVVPMIARIVKPQLGEYEDIQTAEIENGECVITTFSYLDDWKTSFANKRK